MSFDRDPRKHSDSEMRPVGHETETMISPDPWHTLTVESTEQLLGSTPAGLTKDSARERLDRFGPNEIEREGATPIWQQILHQFRDPLIYILLVAGTVTLVLRDFVDSGVIFATVILNAVIGFFQENRAEREMLALSKMSATRATVLRDGEVHQVMARELVPGDRVLLSAGNLVPADIRLTTIQDLAIDESALTGESVPVRKFVEPLDDPRLVPADRKNMGFSGTIVTRGRGKGLVIATGAATELGQIADAVRTVGRSTTPLQRNLEIFGRRIGLTVALLAIVVVVLGVVRKIPPSEIFLTAVALAVSAIPEGLPVVLTVTLAIGVRRMARRNAIIRSLPAVETLGSTTVIGSDKTGTLTRNEMTVREVWSAGRSWEVSGSGYEAAGSIAPAANEHEATALRDTLRAAVLANEAAPPRSGEPHSGDPTEIALLVLGSKGELDVAGLRSSEPELDSIPFESDLLLMASLRECEGARRVHLKGAPEAILARCNQMTWGDGLTPIDRKAATEAASRLAERGLRVIAMAWRDTEQTTIRAETLGDGFTLGGLAGMEDPVRPEAIEAVRLAREAGIRVLMLTGDHVGTAAAIGGQLGLGAADRGAVSGIDLETMTDEELGRVIGEVDIYARVSPAHKLRIVETLKDQGEVVAVTGDGVNDAPALRAAHLGVAMGRGGTDVAREAAAMVLSDDNFATITAAVEEGRVVYNNVRKVTFFLLSTAVGEVLAILAALALGWPLPFVAAQILWINLVTNGVQDIALAFEPGEPGLNRRKPRPQNEPVLTKRLLERLGGVGLVLATGTLFSFLWSLEQTGDLTTARTVAMTQMVVFQFFHVFNSRSLDRSILSIPLFSNRFLFISVAAAMVAHLAVLYWQPLQYVFRTVPLDVTQWLVIIGVGTTVIIGGELDKWRNRMRNTPIG